MKMKMKIFSRFHYVWYLDFSNDDTKLEYNVDADNGIAMEGYLFKRASNAFKTWNRIIPQWWWRTCGYVQSNTVRISNAASALKSCMMQADSEKLRQAWIKAVQNSIATAFREQGEDAEKLDRKSSTSTGSLDSGGEPKERSLKGESALQRVIVIGGNACCLRSLTLDSWEPELLKLMCELGNGVINQIYEARREELGARKPKPADPRQEIEAYIRAKYVDRRFVQRLSNEELRSKVVSLSKQEKRLSSSTEHLPPRPPPSTPKLRPASNASGQSAAAKGLEARRDSLFCPDELDSLFFYFDTSAKLRSKAAEAPPMAMPATLPPPSPCKELVVFTEPKEYSPGLQLYWASRARSLPDMAEALAHGAEVNWNAGNVNQQDALGRGPLHHATILGHTGLRLAKMNEEMREAEGPYMQSGDETYQDIFQDFSQMASNDPEKLNRYQQYDSQQRP
ncbi:unnamed protein product [Coregonus sp. 'balchen']|nr:unnamed protein product [Coregonus sp. 'balchen']